MRVLVIGGAGYIGSHTVRSLLTRGEDVWIFDNLSMGHRQAVPEERLIVGDLKNSDHVESVLKSHQIDAVIHFAAYAFVGESVENPAKYYQNNVVYTLQLLDSLKKLNIQKIVFSSTCATYGIPDRIPITEETLQNPINPYGRTKLMVEHALADYSHAYGLGYAALRYFNAAGAAPDGSIGEDHTPETHLIPLIFQVVLGQREDIAIYGTDYPTPDGTCIRDYIHVIDLAEAHILALEKLQHGTGLKMNLGTGRGYSVRDVIQSIEKITGIHVPVREVSRRAGDPAELVASPKKALEGLGWNPKYRELEAILETAWRFHQSHPHGYR